MHLWCRIGIALLGLVIIYQSIAFGQTMYFRGPQVESGSTATEHVRIDLAIYTSVLVLTGAGLVVFAASGRRLR